MKRGRPKPSMSENQSVFIEAPTSSNKTVSSKPLRKTQHFLFFPFMPITRICECKSCELNDREIIIET